MNGTRYFKWPTPSGDAFAKIPPYFKIPPDCKHPHIIGATVESVVGIDLSDISLVEIDQAEYEARPPVKWRALFGS